MPLQFGVPYPLRCAQRSLGSHASAQVKAASIQRASSQGRSVRGLGLDA